MNKLLTLIATLTFCAQDVYAGAEDTVVSNRTTECVADSTRIEEKLTAFQKFKNIDESNYVLAFHQANLIFSDERAKYSTPTQKAIFFAIQPLPLLNPVAPKYHPKFVARCETKSNPLSLTCTQFPNVAANEQFVIRNFQLNMTFKPNSNCADTNMSQTVNYSLTINGPEYQVVKDQLKALRIPQKTIEEFAKVEDFLGEYWRAFFNAWKDDSWLDS
jgi:hypothetical protein